MAAPSLHLLLLLVASLVTIQVEGGPEVKIHGGSYVDISQFPWQVAIILNGGVCGGSIISKDWVLTAAHCTNKINPKLIKLRVGTSNYNCSDQEYDVDYEVKHPDYDNETHVNDITLLKTSRPISLVGPVSVVKLPTAQPQEIPPSTKLTVTGWGLTGDPEPPPLLKMAELVAVDIAVCEASFGDAVVEPVHLCTDRVDGMACLGDSGGPLMMGDVLVGLVSFGYGICGKGPLVAVKVSAFRDWIQKMTDV